MPMKHESLTELRNYRWFLSLKSLDLTRVSCFELDLACKVFRPDTNQGHRLTCDLVSFSYRDMLSRKALLSNIGQVEKKYCAAQIHSRAT